MAEDDARELDTENAEDRGAEEQPIPQEEEAKTESAKL